MSTKITNSGTFYDGPKKANAIGDIDCPIHDSVRGYPRDQTLEHLLSNFIYQMLNIGTHVQYSNPDL
jgi:hypothetical protein